MFSGISTGSYKAAVIAVAVAALVGGIYWGVGSRLDEREEPHNPLLRALQNRDTSLAPVVATVNGSPISGKTIGFDIAYNREKVAIGFDGESFDPRAILETLIERELVYQEADRLGLLCDQREVEQTSEQMTSGPDIRATFAEAYSVKPEEVYLIPELLDIYARVCAAVNLFTAVLPPERIQALDAEMMQMRADFIADLKAEATIVILEPSLQ